MTSLVRMPELLPERSVRVTPRSTANREMVLTGRCRPLGRGLEEFPAVTATRTASGGSGSQFACRVRPLVRALSGRAGQRADQGGNGDVGAGDEPRGRPER